MKIDPNKPFRTVPGDPAPLRVSIERRVHFNECDPLGVVWHGNYAKYCEEARETLGAACGITFSRLKDSGFVLPLKNFFLDYRRPLLFDRDYRVTVIQHWSEAARINLEYRIYEGAALCCRGFSVQLMVDLQGGLLLDLPEMYRKFLAAWASGSFKALQGAD